MNFFYYLFYKSKAVGGLIFALALLLYFVYHIVQGDRGILAKQKLEQELSEAKKKLEEVQGVRETLENRIELLRTDSIDQDMLEERARVMLDYSHPDDIVIFDTPK